MVSDWSGVGMLFWSALKWSDESASLGSHAKVRCAERDQSDWPWTMRALAGSVC